MLYFTQLHLMFSQFFREGRTMKSLAEWEREKELRERRRIRAEERYERINTARRCPGCGHIDVPHYDSQECYNCRDWDRPEW